MKSNHSKTARDLSRRNWLAGAAAAACAEGIGLFGSTALQASVATTQTTAPPSTKSVAAILTAYEKGLHADVLIGKILEGWNQDCGAGPALKLTSMIYLNTCRHLKVLCKVRVGFGKPIT